MPRCHFINVQTPFRRRLSVTGIIVLAGLLGVGHIYPAPMKRSQPNPGLPAGSSGGEDDGLLDLPSLTEPALNEDPASLLQLQSEILPPLTTTVATAAPRAEIASGPARLADEDYLAAYSVSNPLTRTVLQNARSIGDRFYDGFGGVPHPMDSPLIPRARGSDYLLHLGPVKITPSALALAYNMRFESSDRTSSKVDGGSGVLSGGFSTEIGEPSSGRFVTLDYGAAFTLGSGAGQENNPEQTLMLHAQLDFAKLKLGLGVEFNSLSGENREFGHDIQRDVATVAFTSTYTWTTKTSFEWDLAVPVAEYSGGIDTSGLTNTIMVNYAYSTKTTFGLGFTTGFTEVTGSDTQTFEQVNARMTSTANPFLSYTGTVGFEWRDIGETRTTSPVFGLGATWTPRVGTSLSLAIDQRVQSSAAIAGANYTSTSVALSCSQRLGGFASLGASLGYERASYKSVVSDQTIDRLDQTVFAQASVSRTVFKHVSLSAVISYLHTASSNLPQSSTQVSVSASYTF